MAVACGSGVFAERWWLVLLGGAGAFDKRAKVTADGGTSERVLRRCCAVLFRVEVIDGARKTWRLEPHLMKLRYWMVLPLTTTLPPSVTDGRRLTAMRKGDSTATAIHPGSHHPSIQPARVLRCRFRCRKLALPLITRNRYSVVLFGSVRLLHLSSLASIGQQSSFAVRGREGNVIRNE
jgi:hypothetical protein